MSTGVTARLAQVVLEIAGSRLPPPALAASGRLARHALGAALAGAPLAPARIARAAMPRAPGPCTLIGADAATGEGDAAFANAVAGHAGLLEDSGPGGKREGSHPATYVFPAALAAAEQASASGARFLQALCAGYEAASRVGAVLPAAIFERGFRALPVIGPFGAVAAAGALAGLDAASLAHAFGIAANLSGGLNQGIEDGSMEPFLHPAFAARNGLLAVRLAAAGCTASPRSLEGARGLFATLGGTGGCPLDARVDLADLAVGRVGLKRYATCLYNQGSLDLVRRALPGGLPPASIARAVLRRPANGINGLHAPGVAAPPPYDTPLARQMSARFTLAAALAGRPVDDPAWYARDDADTEVAALAERVSIEPAGDPGVAVDIDLRDGTRRSLANAEIQVLEFSEEGAAELFAAHARRALGERAAAAIELAAALPDLPSLAPLMALARSSARP